MKLAIRPLAVIAACAVLGTPLLTAAQISSEALISLTTPDKLETSIGTLEFKDGAPSQATVETVYDYLDLMHGVEAFINAYQGASTTAAFKGFQIAIFGSLPTPTATVSPQS